MKPIDNPYGRQTVLLHAPADRGYRDHLERHLRFAIAERPIGEFDCLCLDDSAEFRASLEEQTARIAAMVCLISHHFVTADFGYSAHLHQLLRAHRKRQLLMIPIFVDNCSLRISPLARLQRLSANQRAINELEILPGFQESLATLVDETLYEIVSIRKHHEAVWNAWQRANATNTAAAFLRFMQRYPGSRLVGEARARYKKRTEKELWNETLQTGTAAAWSNYLRQSPLNEHKRKAILRLVATETREATARRDAERSDNPGILLDYLARFPVGDRDDPVDRRARYDVADLRTDWEAAIAPLRTEADFLGHRICTSCAPREVETFRLLERSFVITQFKARDLHKKLSELRDAVAAWAIVGLFLTLSLVGIAENLGVEVVAFVRRWVWWLGIVGIIGASYYWSVRQAIRTDAEECDLIYRKLLQNLIEVKIAFLSRDVVRLRKMNANLYRATSRLHAIGIKKWRDYLRVVEWREKPDAPR